MKLKVVFCGSVLGLLALSLITRVDAETRGKPFTEEYLLQNASTIFIGEVLETMDYPEYKRTVPTRVRVLVSIKGNVKPGVRQVVPKHPGLYVYFDEEFDHAQPGRTGVFFVGTKSPNEQPDLLMKYKEIPLKRP